MKLCKKCGKDFSHSVYPLHVTRCKGPVDEVKEETPSAPIDPMDPPADNTQEPTGNTDGQENTTPEESGNTIEPTDNTDGQEVKAYIDMSEQELRVLAKEKGIAAYHNKGLDKIIAELEEMDVSPE